MPLLNCGHETREKKRSSWGKTILGIAKGPKAYSRPKGKSQTDDRKGPLSSRGQRKDQLKHPFERREKSARGGWMYARTGKKRPVLRLDSKKRDAGRPQHRLPQ